MCESIKQAKPLASTSLTALTQASSAKHVTRCSALSTSGYAKPTKECYAPKCTGLSAKWQQEPEIVGLRGQETLWGPLCTFLNFASTIPTNSVMLYNCRQGLQAKCLFFFHYILIVLIYHIHTNYGAKNILMAPLLYLWMRILLLQPILDFQSLKIPLCVFCPTLTLFICLQCCNPLKNFAQGSRLLPQLLSLPVKRAF